MDSPRHILRQLGLSPKHSWGQNFLGEPEVLEQIARAIAPAPGERVLELGAGLGHLTQALISAGAQVIAVERDRDLARVLRAKELPGVTVLEANAAKLNLAQAAGTSPVAVVGNLPYHLTSPILFELLEQHKDVSRAVFTLQKEVVDRLCAPPGGRDYGLLSVLLGLFFRSERMFEVRRELFHPPPRVDSAVLRLTRLDTPRAAVTEPRRFIRVVKAAFAHRRKTLINSLKSDASLASADEWARALEAAGVDSMRRAETLSVEEFAALERALGPTVD